MTVGENGRSWNEIQCPVWLQMLQWSLEQLLFQLWMHGWMGGG